MQLSKKKCLPCEGGIPPLNEAEEKQYITEVLGWKLKTETVHRIEKEYKFKNFVKAIEFVNSAAEIAESEGHHPHINILYNRVIIEIYTHAVLGLTENDFILAAKIDEIKLTDLL
ncbi:MAG: 4a-hydroxytetrahydrobiopterin dehydratase [Melioribacteraceae bacterium]|nr:4a-hydroxytetrahydrobiopterin dehydratase [Melioribacteraceae bacterium]